MMKNNNKSNKLHDLYTNLDYKNTNEQYYHNYIELHDIVSKHTQMVKLNKNRHNYYNNILFNISMDILKYIFAIIISYFFLFH